MEKIIKLLKNAPLLADHERDSYQRQAIERMILHRVPFLLIDKTTHLNLAKR